MKIINKKDDQRSKIHKAANTAADYQMAWKEFVQNPTHEGARDVMRYGESTIEEQNTTGLSMINPQHIRHRILTAQDYLEKTPEKEAQETIKGWVRKADGTLDYVGVRK